MWTWKQALRLLIAAITTVLCAGVGATATPPATVGSIPGTARLSGIVDSPTPFKAAQGSTFTMWTNASCTWSIQTRAIFVPWPCSPAIMKSSAVSKGLPDPDVQKLVLKASDNPSLKVLPSRIAP